MNELYPVKFKPILKDKIWGGARLRDILNKQGASDKCGESWEISGVQYNISIVSNGFLKGNNLQEIIEIYLGDIVGDKGFDKYGIEFPLLIKFIDANDKLSIQVHPDDELAAIRHQAYGKTEMWYIVEADVKAELISGFKKQLDEKTYLHHLQNKTLPDILNFEKVSAGDAFFVPAGRVHAIGPGILLAEIQQTSDITYRIYDWDRVDDKGKPRDLHTDLALKAIDYKHYDNYRTQYKHENNQTAQIVDCRYFTTNLLDFDSTVEKAFHLIDSFVIYMCLEGSYDLYYGNNESVDIHKGETVLVPAVIRNITLIPLTPSRLL